MQASLLPIYAQGDDAVVAVTEALDDSVVPPVRAWIARLGPQGVVWRYDLEDVPPGTELESAFSPPAPGRPALLVLTFQTPRAPQGGHYGQALSIDLASGKVDPVVVLDYPRVPAHGRPDEDDRLHVFGALRLYDGRIAVYGGDDAGPYRWWVGLRGADGTFLWDAGAPRRGYGEAQDMRETATGLEVLVNAIAYTADYRDRHLLVRLSRTGRIMSIDDLGSLGASEIAFVGADRLMVAVEEGDDYVVRLRGPGSATRQLARLPRESHFDSQAGRFLVFVGLDGRRWFLDVDGQPQGADDGIDAPPVDGRYVVDARGRPAQYVLQQKCLDEPSPGQCRRLELSLVRLDF